MLSRRAAVVSDVAPAVFVVAVTALLATGRSGPGDPLEGPTWLRVLMPVLLGLPLAVRRRYPLAAWCTVMGAVAAQSVISGTSPEGLHVVVALFVGSYAVGAHATRGHALAGLIATLVGWVPFTVNVRGLGQPDDDWAIAFFLAATLGCWLLGFALRNRREGAALAERAAELEVRSEQAVEEERRRIARELHDIVSHRLAVVVAQAAGGRAREGAAPGALEKIEGQAREALVEMRRMLGLLREDGADPEGVTPAPGLSDLPALVAAVSEAGLPCELSIAGDVAGVPRAVGLSTYRIVQESLTNALRHARAQKGEVLVEARPDELRITVRDDGRGMPARPRAGHGLTGMRERATLLGGKLSVESTTSGVRVHAVLPLQGGAT